jgi:hypothetical protein
LREQACRGRDAAQRIFAAPAVDRGRPQVPQDQVPGLLRDVLRYLRLRPAFRVAALAGKIIKVMAGSRYLSGLRWLQAGEPGFEYRCCRDRHGA